MKHFFTTLLPVSALLWIGSVTTTFATEYVDVNVTVVANNEILLDSTEYITTDGCTVTDALGTEYEVEGAKAVCALYSAAQAEGLGLSFTDYGGDFGLLITGIGDVQTNIDLEWYWLYYLNGGYPIGVSNQEVGSGDNLVFTYGYWTAAGAPLTLELSDTQVVEDQRVDVQVLKNDNDGEGYVPAEGATVFVNDWQYTTDEQGYTEFAVPRRSVKQVYAELEGYTRTVPVEVRIYTRHAKKQPVRQAVRVKMAKRGLATLTHRYQERTIAQSPSLRDWAVMALAVDNQAQRSFSQGAQSYNAQVTGMSTDISRNVLSLASIDHNTQARRKADQLRMMHEPCDDAFINDEIYAVLAFEAVSQKRYANAIKRNVRCAIAQQEIDGGMPLTAGGFVDMDTTATFVQMLSAIDQPRHIGLRTAAIRRAKIGALRYLRSNQNPDGGWGYAANEPSNSSTTATVLMAFDSAGKYPGKVRTNKRNGYNFLQRTQKRNGAFRYDLLGNYSVEEMNTIFASMALLNTYFPVNHAQ